MQDAKFKCFKINSNEVNGRLDVYYYDPKFTALEKKLGQKSSETLNDYIVSMAGGATPNKDKASEYYTDKSGIPFIRVQNLSPEGLRLDDTKYITKEVHNGMLKRSQVSENDLLVKITGVGRMAISSVAPSNFIGNINQHIVTIKTKDRETSEVLASFLNSDIGERLSSRRSTGGTRPALDYEALKSIPIVYKPEIVEIMNNAYKQKKQKTKEATEILDSIDDYVLGELGIKINEQKNKMCFAINAEEAGNRQDCNYHQPKYKQAEDAINKGKYKISPLGKYITKIHYGVSIKNNYVDEGIPLLRILNLKPNKIELKKVVRLSEKCRKEIGSGFVYENDLLISRSGSVGIVAVVPKEADGFAFGSFMIKFCLNDEINKDFVSIWLNNRIAQLFIQREKIGAIQGNITIETIKGFDIPFPLIGIQEKIVKEVKERIKKADKLKVESKDIIAKAKEEVEKIILGK